MNTEFFEKAASGPEADAEVLDIPIPTEVYVAPLAVVPLPSLPPSEPVRGGLLSFDLARRRKVLRRVSLAAAFIISVVGTTARAGSAPERPLVAFEAHRAPPEPVMDLLPPVTVDLNAALVALDAKRTPSELLARTKHRFARTASVPSTRRRR